MASRRAKVTCTAQGSKSTCKAQNPLYYKGLWGKDDWKLRCASDRSAPGIERTDEELLQEYLYITERDARARELQEEEEGLGKSSWEWMYRMYHRWLKSA